MFKKKLCDTVAVWQMEANHMADVEKKQTVTSD